jgi:serine protease AprX
LEEATLRRFVFQTFGRARRTQDSPVMPDVWLRYIRVAETIANARIYGGNAPADLVDLLLTPWSGVRPGQIAKELRDLLSSPTAKRKYPVPPAELLGSSRLALSESRVVVCASFETLVRNVVPLSNWWRNLFRRKNGTAEEKRARLSFDEAFRIIEDDFDEDEKPSGQDVELSRYAALVGFVDLLQAAKSEQELRNLAALAYRLGPPPELPDAETGVIGNFSPEQKRLLKQIYEHAKELLRPANGEPKNEEHKGVYLISLNRSAAQTIFESRATIKADAAENVFDIDTTGIKFAVIDGGIDATHPAFLKRSDERVKELLKQPKGLTDDDYLKFSRVLKTYDFTLVRDIVALAGNEGQVAGPNSEKIKRLFGDDKNKEAFTHLKIRGERARDLDWEIVSPLIEIAQDRLPEKSKGGKPQASGKASDVDAYIVPGTPHGTHVAGILAGDFLNDPGSGRDLIGMCRQLSLYDLRVFDANGRGDEFAILCAIEFVGWLNRDRANPVVHGVNLSLALAHDVDSFACGQTPICEACNHLVGAGTVVVVAAGNSGFEGGPAKQSLGTGYRAISITDPGNADDVITVGSTHRRDPHLYGVSYFSARGPTGDGRRKPDILAPGEKITSTIPGGRSQRMDGTSMAAPHVSGAAALLMARYPELIGKPLRIKEILMKTATDLNREASFQGAGLVDVLRALQSV